MSHPLDIEQPGTLIAYLRDKGHIAAHETPRIVVLVGGVSNRTVLVERESGEAWVIKQALEKLRVKVDWFSSPERIHREATGLRWLARLAPHGTITPLVFEDFDAHLLAMQAVSQPHENWKTMLLRGYVERDHVEQFARLLASIHINASHEPQAAEAFDDRSFFVSLRIEPYYGYTAECVPEAAGFLRSLIEDTLAQRHTLVHGDYSPKNILVHNEKLVLLDHEVIHWGDLAFDLGFSLTHLLSKAHYLIQFRGDFLDAATRYWQVYKDATTSAMWTTGLEERVVRHTLGCLLARVAGRSPLEYLTDDERQRQRSAVLQLIAQQPSTVIELIERFHAEIEKMIG